MKIYIYWCDLFMNCLDFYGRRYVIIIRNVCNINVNNNFFNFIKVEYMYIIKYN